MTKYEDINRFASVVGNYYGMVKRFCPETKDKPITVTVDSDERQIGGTREYHMTALAQHNGREVARYREKNPRYLYLDAGDSIDDIEESAVNICDFIKKTLEKRNLPVKRMSSGLEINLETPDNQ